MSYTIEDFKNESGKEFVDISSEQYRCYQFPDYNVIISSPLLLNVSDSGGHRVWDAGGKSHYIPTGWIHLYWEVREGAPNFVK
jgi:hypothetical protein